MNGTAVEVVHVQHADSLMPAWNSFSVVAAASTSFAFGEDLARLGVDDVVREHLADR
jgi:hypothetical protein